MDAIADLVAEIRGAVSARVASRSSRGEQPADHEVDEDLTTLDAHAHPGPGVFMEGQPRACATCGEPMPCTPLRRLGATYGVLVDAPDAVSGVQSTTGVVGPTGVRSMTPDDPDAGGEDRLPST